MAVETIYKGKLSGRISTNTAWLALEGMYNAVYSSNATEVILDVSEVTLLCPEAIRILFMALNLLTTRGGDISLVQPSDQVRTALKLGAWDQVFGIYDSEAEAISGRKYEKGESI